MTSWQVAITGNRPWLPGTFLDGTQVHWHCIPVLDFRPLPLVPLPIDPQARDLWCLFASARGVEFWLEQGWGATLDVRMHYGAVGARTAQRLEDLGERVELIGDGTGAEALLGQFQAHPNGQQWPVVVVSARGGRTVLTEGLKAAGRQVFHCEVYESFPRTDLEEGLWEKVKSADAVVFTSPSSVEALLQFGQWQGVAVALGKFTAAALKKKGIEPLVMPTPDLQEVGKLLKGKS